MSSTEGLVNLACTRLLIKKLIVSNFITIKKRTKHAISTKSRYLRERAKTLFTFITPERLVGRNRKREGDEKEKETPADSSGLATQPAMSSASPAPVGNPGSRFGPVRRTIRPDTRNARRCERDEKSRGSPPVSGEERKVYRKDIREVGGRQERAADARATAADSRLFPSTPPAATPEYQTPPASPRSRLLRCRNRVPSSEFSSQTRCSS